MILSWFQVSWSPQEADNCHGCCFRNGIFTLKKYCAFWLEMWQFARELEGSYAANMQGIFSSCGLFILLHCLHCDKAKKLAFHQVGDFGLSKIKRNTLVSGGVRGTLPWMAPELLNGSSNKVSEKVQLHILSGNLESPLVTMNTKIASYRLIQVYLLLDFDFATNKLVVQLAPPYAFKTFSSSSNLSHRFTLKKERNYYFAYLVDHCPLLSLIISIIWEALIINVIMFFNL